MGINKSSKYGCMLFCGENVLVDIFSFRSYGKRNKSVGKYLRKVEKRLFDEIDGRNLDSKP